MTNGEEGTAGTENPPESALASAEGAPGEQAITPGAVVPATTTIDALFTSVYSTRSADLAATPVYTWAVAPVWPTLVATWAAANNPSVAMTATFQVRNGGPAQTGGATSSVLP